MNEQHSSPSRHITGGSDIQLGYIIEANDSRGSNNDGGVGDGHEENSQPRRDSGICNVTYLKLSYVFENTIRWGERSIPLGAYKLCF